MTEPELIEAMAQELDPEAWRRSQKWKRHIRLTRQRRARRQARAALSAIKARGCKVMGRPPEDDRELGSPNQYWDNAPTWPGEERS